MNSYLVIFVLGITILSFGSQAGQWHDMKWDRPVGHVVVQYNMESGQTAVFAEEHDTGDLYEWDGLMAEWNRVAHVSARYATDGIGLYRLQEDGRIGKYNPQTGLWTNILASGNNAFDLYGGAGKLYYKKDDGSIYEYEGTPQQWTKILDGPTSALDGYLRIGGEINEPKVYAYPMHGALYEYQGTPENWEQIYAPQNFIYILAGGPGLFGMDENGFYRITGPNSRVKITEAGRSAAVQVVDKGKSCYLLVLSNDGDRIQRYDAGVAPTNLLDAMETIITATRLDTIYAGGNKIIGVDSSGGMYQYF